ncbi:MAG: aspartate aminotransferase family protein, partial [Bacteroidetes bacterium]
GTFNGHFIGSLAGIATLKKLKSREKEIYGYLDELGARMETGIASIFSAKGVPLTIARQGSVFTTYFMDKEPENWNDIAKNHDSSFDINFRKKLINAGVYVVPMSAKQYSVSFAHTKKDIDTSLEIIEKVVKEL